MEDTEALPVEALRVSYVAGGSPKGARFRAAIIDPPCSGESNALILRGKKGYSTVLCPYTLSAFTVPDDCAELAQARPTSTPIFKLVERLKSSWLKFTNLGMQRDYDLAALFLTRLGAEVPTERPVGLADRAPRSTGKEAVEKAADTKPIRPGTRRAEVAMFFKDDWRPLREAMASLSMSRSNVLSHLFCIKRDHGFGYELDGERARLQIPPSAVLFEEGTSETKQRKPREDSEGPKPRGQSAKRTRAGAGPKSK